MTRGNGEHVELDQKVREALRAGHLKRPDWQVVGLLAAGTAMATTQASVLLVRHTYAWHTWAMIGGAVILLALTVAFACWPRLRRVSPRRTDRSS